MTDDAIDLDPELQRRLDEWSRWARQRHWQSACRSIESRYRAPAAEVWNPEPKPMPVAILAAWQVECIWRTRLKFRDRMLLKAVFITAPRGSAHAWEAHKRRTCRELMIHRNKFADEVRRVTSAIDRALQTAEYAVRIRVLAPPHGDVRVDTAQVGGIGVREQDRGPSLSPMARNAPLAGSA